MNRRSILATLGAGALSAACGGGGHDRPESESNLYGYTIDQLMQTAPLLRREEGPLAVQARGGQTSFFVPGITFPEYDPFTGRTTFDRIGESYSMRAWYVVVSALSPEGSEVATGWIARTIWVLSAGQFISSRDVKDLNSGAFGAVFLNPPFAVEGTWAVAEMVRGHEIQLVGAQIAWTLSDPSASHSSG